MCMVTSNGSSVFPSSRLQALLKAFSHRVICLEEGRTLEAFPQLPQHQMVPTSSGSANEEAEVVTTLIMAKVARSVKQEGKNSKTMIAM